MYVLILPVRSRLDFTLHGGAATVYGRKSNPSSAGEKPHHKDFHDEQADEDGQCQRDPKLVHRVTTMQFDAVHEDARCCRRSRGTTGGKSAEKQFCWRGSGNFAGVEFKSRRVARML